MKKFKSYLIIFKKDNQWRRYVCNSYDKALNLFDKLSGNPKVTEKRLKSLGQPIN